MTPPALRIVPALMLPVLLALLPAFAAPAAGQTILNVERLTQGDTAGWQGAIEGSASVSGGNEEVVDVSAGGMVGHRRGPHWVRLMGGVGYRSDDGESVTSDRFAHLRYNYVLGPRWRTFHFVQVQASRSLLLERRVLAGTGVRRTLFRDARTQVDLGTGVMREWERLDEDEIGPEDRVTSRAWRMANLASLARAFSDDVRLVATGYFQPELSDFGDRRALVDASLLVGLTEAVDLAVRAEWRHDSRPPAGVEPDDLFFQTGIVLSVR